MKALRTVVVVMATACPLAASAQALDSRALAAVASRIDGFGQWPQALLEAEDADALYDGRAGSIELAARVVTRVGPRGGVRRTFVYRGRPLAVIRRPAFVYPPGHVYRRWAVGLLLPAALFASTYYFLEWQAAGLRAPPPSHQWVRHGPDLLLIDTRNGKVIEVAPGAIEEG